MHARLHEDSIKRPKVRVGACLCVYDSCCSNAIYTIGTQDHFDIPKGMENANIVSKNN